MKKIWLLIVVAGLVGILIGCSNPYDDDDTTVGSQIQAALNRIWGNYIQDKANWQGGILMEINCPQGIFFFQKDFETTAYDHDHFRAASVTKTFTAAAIMLLQQRGLLNIDNAITAFMPGTTAPYVPDTANYDLPYKNQITIRLLLGHRAGVFDVSNDPIPDTAQAPYAGKYYITYIREDLGDNEHTFTFDELVGVAAANDLSYWAPGGGYHYSNTGYSILGKIIERVSGLSYSQFIQDNFFDLVPLEESSSPDQGDQMSLPLPYLTGYAWSAGQSEETTDDNMSPHVAEGNIISTPGNLIRWARALYSGNAGIDRNSLAQMMDVSPTGEGHGTYGLGTTYTPGLGYGHNGGHAGYLTVMRYDPDNDVSIVIVCSVINFDDLGSQLNMMYDAGREARGILGYPTE